MAKVNKTVWQIIFDTLKKNGINVYPPATKNGECKSPYVIFKFSGSTQYYSYSTQRDYYDFYLYVPRNAYSELPNFEAEVKKILDSPPLYPMIMPTGSSENDYYDDNINAHLRTFTYYNNKRVKHL